MVHHVGVDEAIFYGMRRMLWASHSVAHPSEQEPRSSLRASPGDDGSRVKQQHIGGFCVSYL